MNFSDNPRNSFSQVSNHVLVLTIQATVNFNFLMKDGKKN